MASATSSHPRGRALGGVSQAYVFSMRPQPLGGLWVSFHELAQRQMILLDQFVDLIYRTHLEGVMNLGENRIEMGIARSAWFPPDFPFSYS
jgi:hypothetical protein